MAQKKKVESEADVFETGEKFALDNADGWFTFAKVGDRIGGKIVDMFETPAKGLFKAQRVFTLQIKDGTIWNVGLKRTEYILTRTDALQLGDELGVTFEKEIPPKEKGMHPAKSLVFVSKKNGPRVPGTQARDMKPVAVSKKKDADEEIDEDQDLKDF